jgi:hypothetical protein
MSKKLNKYSAQSCLQRLLGILINLADKIMPVLRYPVLKHQLDHFMLSLKFLRHYARELFTFTPKFAMAVYQHSFGSLGQTNKVTKNSQYN